MKVDQSEIEIYLLEIAHKLQRQVHLKNRIDLFNKAGLGLNFAIQKGSDQYLKEGEYHFYHHLIHSKVPESLIRGAASQPEEELLTLAEGREPHAIHHEFNIH